VGIHDAAAVQHALWHDGLRELVVLGQREVHVRDKETKMQQ
jgi:hypothetical protein